VPGRWCGDHYVEATASSKTSTTSHHVEASAFTTKAVTETLSKSVAEVLEELALNVMVAK
jgi:hypothetical protein